MKLCLQLVSLMVVLTLVAVWAPPFALGANHMRWGQALARLARVRG